MIKASLRIKHVYNKMSRFMPFEVLACASRLCCYMSSTNDFFLELFASNYVDSNINQLTSFQIGSNKDPHFTNVHLKKMMTSNN